MTTKILKKLNNEGIHISPSAYEKLKLFEDSDNLVSSLIIKLKSNKEKKSEFLIITDELIEGIKNNLPLENKKIIENDQIPKVESSLSSSESKNHLNHENKDNFIKDNYDNKIKVDKLNEVSTINNTPTKEKHEPTTEKNTSTIQKSTSIYIKEEDELPEKVKIEVEKVEFTNHHKNGDLIKRNISKFNPDDFEFKIIQDTTNKSYTSGTVKNLKDYFLNRYEKIKSILVKRPELKKVSSINDILNAKNDVSLVVMINEIRETKNNHILLEVEDETGFTTVLISKDNKDIYGMGKFLIKDEVIGITGSKKGTLFIASNIIHPSVPRIKQKNMDFSVAFISDVHIGSETFLEDSFQNFIRWVNGDFGNEEQTKIANDIKYLIIAGDLVDGIGIYPNQDEQLIIKDITQQYDEAARLLGDLRSDVKIIIGPGNHDASRIAEPQPAIPESYAQSLYNLKNVEFISNPGLVSLEGIKVLVYHGRSFDDIAMSIKGFSQSRTDLIMKELLEKRHLAPIYGERTSLASELEDHLVIDEVPDVLHTGHIHINSYKNHKGIHLINSGTFQSQTEFQKIYNIMPTCAEVPILNRGSLKTFKFI